jgi:formylmethanofuran dehydrogenase subunit E
MQVSEYFKVENKEYAISNSSVSCSKCGENLAKFEVALFGTICADCKHRY